MEGERGSSTKPQGAGVRMHACHRDREGRGQLEKPIRHIIGHRFNRHLKTCKPFFNRLYDM